MQLRIGGSGTTFAYSLPCIASQTQSPLRVFNTFESSYLSGWMEIFYPPPHFRPYFVGIFLEFSMLETSRKNPG